MKKSRIIIDTYDLFRRKWSILKNLRKIQKFVKSQNAWMFKFSSVYLDHSS